MESSGIPGSGGRAKGKIPNGRGPWRIVRGPCGVALAATRNRKKQTRVYVISMRNPPEGVRSSWDDLVKRDKLVCVR